MYYISFSVDLLTLCRYWNYLRKQTFVLESYTSKVNWIMNRALFSSHCYLSWGFVVPYLMAMTHVAAALQIYIQGYAREETTFVSNGEHINFSFSTFFFSCDVGWGVGGLGWNLPRY